MNRLPFLKTVSEKVGKWVSEKRKSRSLTVLLAFSLTHLLTHPLTCSAQSGLRSPAFVAGLQPQTAGAAAYNPATEPNGILLFRADTIVGYNHNDPLDTWSADVGSPASQATGINQPIFQTNVKAGKPAVLFSHSAASFMKTPTMTTIPQPFTVYIVFKYTGSLLEGNRVLESLTANAGDEFRMANFVATTTWYVYAGNGSTAIQEAGSDNTAWHIWEGCFDGASSFYRFDGGTRTACSGTPGPDAFKGMTIGAASDGTENFDGYIAEIIVRNKASTTLESAAIFDYANGKWQVYP